LVVATKASSILSSLRKAGAALDPTRAQASAGPEPAQEMKAPALRRVAPDVSDAEGDLSTTLLMIASDVLAIVTAFAFAYWVRFGTSLLASEHVAQDDATIRAYWIGALTITALFVLILGNRGLYVARRNTGLAAELVNVAKAISFGMLLVLAVAFYFREASYSRAVFSLFWALSVLAVFIGRAATIALERRHYRAGRRLQKAIVIGSGPVASDVYRELDGHESFGIRIGGYFAADEAASGSKLAQARRLGSPAQAASYIRTQGIHLVLVAVDPSEHDQVIAMVRACEGTNTNFLVVPDFLESMTSRVKVKELGRIPFLALKTTPLALWHRILKRSFDFVAALLLLILTAPVLVFLALLVRLTSQGPILFAQRRVGLAGHEFTMYKFRSMHVGSEKTDRQAGLGIDNDPRCTTLGSFMRRTSLDELPQLFNVLRGDMSLVGPRPERTHCVEDFKRHVPKYLERHRVKAGLTGWAQVNGLRGNTSLAERIRYDLFYIENWSLALDLRIILRTVRSIIQK
jgi:Undecaprenyl-phosphate glucose phosphotransferase